MNRWIIGNKTLLFTRQVGTDDDGNHVAVLELIECIQEHRGKDDQDPSDAVDQARMAGMDCVKIAFLGLESLDDFIKKLRVMRKDMVSWIEAAKAMAEDPPPEQPDEAARGA